MRYVCVGQCQLNAPVTDPPAQALGVTGIQPKTGRSKLEVEIFLTGAFRPPPVHHLISDHPIFDSESRKVLSSALNFPSFGRKLEPFQFLPSLCLANNLNHQSTVLSKPGYPPIRVVVA